MLWTPSRKYDQASNSVGKEYDAWEKVQLTCVTCCRITLTHINYFRKASWSITGESIFTWASTSECNLMVIFNENTTNKLDLVFLGSLYDGKVLWECCPRVKTSSRPSWISSTRCCASAMPCPTNCWKRIVPSPPRRT